MRGIRLIIANRIAKKRLKNMYWWRYVPYNRFRKMRNYSSGMKGKKPGRRKNKMRKEKLNKETKQNYKNNYFDKISDLEYCYKCKKLVCDLEI